MQLPEHCTLCPRRCGANRAAGRTGYCGAGDTLLAARAALHHWEEPCLSGDPNAATGSGTVFIKNIVKYGFGICPNLDGLVIQTAATMPTTDASINVNVKGHPVTLKYINKNAGNRTFEINGKPASGTFDPLMNTPKIFIPTSDITDNMVITVTD